MAESEAPPFAHNLVSSLYALKGAIESYFLNREEGLFEDPRQALEASERALRAAQRQAEHSLKMVRRLNQVLRKEGPASFQSVSLSLVFRKALELAAKEFPGQRIEILDRIPESFPLLRADPEDLEEILYHLIHNAFQALEGKGRLILRASLGFSTQEEPLALIQLADTGPGISRSHLPRLFLPFFTTKPTGQGNGLGLYVTQELVRRNGGQIRLSSFPGSGTTCTIELAVIGRDGSAKAPH